jgi:ubiquinone/menaquinone biosynthesis C-methylase UbiE
MAVSFYYDIDKKHISEKEAELLVGDFFEEAGLLQLKFLVDYGLKTNHKLLDIGCGCLRGGIKFIEYLGDENYYGSDVSKKLLTIGKQKLYDKNIKCNDNNFTINDNFNFSSFKDTKFQFAVGVSLFLHLHLNHLKLCLYNLYDYLEVGGKFYVTFFEAENVKYISEPCLRVEKFKDKEIKTTTYFYKDPYHHFKQDLISAIPEGLNYEFEYIGKWEHFQGQNIVCYTKIA